MTVPESTDQTQDPPGAGRPVPGPPSSPATPNSEWNDALRAGVGAHVERVRASGVAKLDVLDLRDQYIDQCSVLACAIAEEARLRREQADQRETIRRAEIRATLRPDVDGKTVEIRKAQIEQFAIDDPTHQSALAKLRAVEYDLVLQQGNAEVARERTRLYRALLATLATGLLP